MTDQRKIKFTNQDGTVSWVPAKAINTVAIMLESELSWEDVELREVVGGGWEVNGFIPLETMPEADDLDEGFDEAPDYG